MPETRWRRPHHQAVARVLEALNGEFLLDAGCYFGGGTGLALLLGEYRESRDIDFLCSSREGFRAVREAICVDSLGRIARRALPLAREVRADRDGVRTFVAVGDARIKLELIVEARIDLSGAMDRRLGVPVLTLACLAAEKLLANADRGLDDGTWSRDVIDLAFLAAKKGPEPITTGMPQAERAYGAAVRRGLQQSLAHLSQRRGRLAECARALGISDMPALRRGLKILRRLGR